MHLGKYWSGRITLKENHRIIQTGLYAWVRHPIYSGLILALFGTAITLGTIPAFAGFAFMLISFVRKLKIEETWLRSQFGAEYEAYQNRVKALIPELGTQQQLRREISVLPPHLFVSLLFVDCGDDRKPGQGNLTQ
jgi:protein-S-isoprenylcysteine O-methyltransferase Ste14